MMKAESRNLRFIFVFPRLLNLLNSLHHMFCKISQNRVTTQSTALHCPLQRNRQRLRVSRARIS
jgi:hypothetical protein